MRSIHSGFPWVFPEFSDPADATNSTRDAVRATTARLASRRQSVEPRRCEKGFSATPAKWWFQSARWPSSRSCAARSSRRQERGGTLPWTDQQCARPGTGTLINLGRLVRSRRAATIDGSRRSPPRCACSCIAIDRRA